VVRHFTKPLYFVMPRRKTAKKVTAGPRRPKARGRGSYRVQGSPNMNLQGQGGFWGDVWERGRKFIPRALGGAAGYLAGGAPGAAKGWGMGGQFSKNILGWGDYGVPWQVSNNSLITASGVPTMHDTGDSGFKIQHQEFLGPIFSTTSFSSNTYSVNPGLWATFPWLSAIAANFQQYRLLGAVVAFEPVLPDGMAAFTSLGSVMIAAQMNPAAANFASETQMMQTKFVTAGKPTQKLWAPIECSPISGSGSNNLLIRTNAVPANQVVNNYDHCKITVATTGQPSAGVMLGKIWFTTEVLLLNPCSGEGLGVWGAHYDLLTGNDTTHPLGTSPTKVYDDFSLTLSTTSKTVTFPVGIIGKLQVQYYLHASSGAMTLPTLTLTNATQLTQLVGPGSGETASYGCITWYINVTDSSVATVLTFGNATFTSSATGCHLFVNDVSSNYA